MPMKKGSKKRKLEPEQKTSLALRIFAIILLVAGIIKGDDTVAVEAFCFSILSNVVLAFLSARHAWEYAHLNSEYIEKIFDQIRDVLCAQMKLVEKAKSLEKRVDEVEKIIKKETKQCPKNKQ